MASPSPTTSPRLAHRTLSPTSRPQSQSKSPSPAASPSPSDSPAIPDNPTLSADLPMTMSASIVLTHLPQDATSALAQAGAFANPKVTVRFKAVGSAPILKQQVCRISSEQRFETVVRFLRRKLGVAETGAGGDMVFCYVNSVFAPALDEVVGNLHRCFRNQHDDQLVVAYSMTPAFG